MKVKDLIQELQKYDLEMDCVTNGDHDGSGYDTDTIRGVHPVKVDRFGNLMPEADIGNAVLYFDSY